jgi:hypothetical protein
LACCGCVPKPVQKRILFTIFATSRAANAFSRSLQVVEQQSWTLDCALMGK